MPTIYEDLTEDTARDIMRILDMNSMIKMIDDFMADLNADIEILERSRAAKVKSEKTSDGSSLKDNEGTAPSKQVRIKAISVKKEQTEMPPLTEPVRKGMARKAKRKLQEMEMEQTRESDVYIHPTKISLINLDNSDENEKNKENQIEVEEEKEELSVRNARTKIRAKAIKDRKVAIWESRDGSEESGKRFNTSSPVSNNKRQKSMEVAKNIDETFVKLPAKPANATYFKPPDSTINPNAPVDVNITYTLPTIGLENPPTTAPRNEATVTKTPQNITYNIDLLTDGDDDDDLPLKQAKPGKAISNTYGNSLVKARVKAFEKLQTKISSALKKIRVLKPTETKRVLPPKTASAIKAYQQDYIDRELKQKARENEQQPSQKSKADIGSVKIKQEVPRKEVKGPVTPKPQVKVPTQCKPIFLDVSAPMLPVNDWGARRVPRPNWTRKERMFTSSKRIYFYGPTVTNTFFMCKPTTINLESFGKMPAKKLIRSSSAVWNKPPRFTLMPINSEHEDL